MAHSQRQRKQKISQGKNKGARKISPGTLTPVALVLMGKGMAQTTYSKPRAMKRRLKDED